MKKLRREIFSLSLFITIYKYVEKETMYHRVYYIITLKSNNNIILIRHYNIPHKIMQELY